MFAHWQNNDDAKFFCDNLVTNFIKKVGMQLLCAYVRVGTAHGRAVMPTWHAAMAMNPR